MRKLIVIVILILCTTEKFASQQNDNFKDYQKYLNNIIPVVSQWSFNDYSKEGSVNISTGSFGISIPICNIQDDGFSLPVGISYATSGIKVNENASEVGINWELVSGGTITRKVMGSRDEGQSYNEPSGTSLFEYAGSFYPLSTAPFQTTSSNIWTTESQHMGSLNHMQLKMFNEYFPRPADPTLNYESNIAQSVYQMLRTESNKDFNRDIFTFNVGNLNFRFAIADKEGIENFQYEALPLDEKGIKIEYEIKQINTTSMYSICENCQTEPAFSKFIITDKTGIKYFFEDYELFEYEYVYNYHQYPVDPATIASPWILMHSSAQNSENYRKYNFQHLMKAASIDKWYLSKIVFPNGKQINLSYSTTKYTEYNVQNRSHDGEYLGFPNNTTPKYNSGYFDKLKTYTHKKYINSILADDFNTRVYFNYTDQRPDYVMGGKNLDQIRVTDKLNKIIKQFILNKEFSNADMGEGADDYRMFLSAIKQMQITDREDYSSNTLIDNQYIFHYYNIEALPQKNFLPYTDLYGYYLGNKGAAPILNNLAFPKVFLYPNETDGNRISYEPYAQSGVETNGIDRRPKRANGPIEGAMSEIIFPTKGKLKITYEPNTYFFDKGSNKNPYGPGVRVKKLENIDDQNNKIIREYYYTQFQNSNTSGNLLYKPSYAYLSNLVNNNTINHDISLNMSEVNFLKFYRFDKSTTAKELERQGNNTESIIRKMIVLSNKSIGPIQDIFGREILYTNVLEKFVNTNNSSENYSKKYYLNYEDNATEVQSVSGPTDEPTYITPANYNLHWDENYAPWTGILPNSSQSIFLKMSYGFIEKKGKNIYPFPDRNYFDMNNELLNGKIQKVESLNNLNQLVSSEEYSYEPLIVINKSLHLLRNRGFNVAVLPTHIYDNADPQKYHIEFHPNRQTNGANINDYFFRYRRGVYLFTDTKQYFQRPTRIKSIKKTNYFNSGNTVQISSYDYSPYMFNNTSAITTFNNTNDILQVKKAYLNDLLESGQQVDYSTDMIARNMVAIPLLKEEFKNSKKLQKTTVRYSKDWSGHSLLLPKFIESSFDESSTVMEETVTFEQYDNKGNPIQYKSKFNIPTAIVWGYNQSQPIAKIEGASYTDIAQYINNIVSKSDVDVNNTSEEILINALDEFRKNPALINYQITTYTYDPLIGVTSITPPSGIREIYKYDAANRLEKVIDMNGKILKELKYNYKQ